jgi:hypothetical protein
MDVLELLQLFLVLASVLVAPLLEQVTNFTSRSSAIGFIFMVLIVTSIVETFVIGIFRLIRMFFIVVLACLFGTQLLSWLLSDIPLKDEEDSANEEREGWSQA